MKRSCVTCQGVSWRIHPRHHGPRVCDGPGPSESITDPWSLTVPMAVGASRRRPRRNHHVGPAGGPAAAGSSAATPKAAGRSAKLHISPDKNAGQRDQINAGKREQLIKCGPKGYYCSQGTSSWSHGTCVVARVWLPDALVSGVLGVRCPWFPEGEREREREQEKRHAFQGFRQGAEASAAEACATQAAPLQPGLPHASGTGPGARHVIS